MWLIHQKPLTFVSSMIRILSSYMLTAVILLSQMGLPLHFHYCKGMLESVSLFISAGCDNHEEEKQIVEIKSCCKKAEAPTCEKTTDGCCDNEMKVLTQVITSISPQIMKWVDIYTTLDVYLTQNDIDSNVVSFFPTFFREMADNGPPIYLRYHSLIFYA